MDDGCGKAHLDPWRGPGWEGKADFWEAEAERLQVLVQLEQLSKLTM